MKKQLGKIVVICLMGVGGLACGLSDLPFAATTSLPTPTLIVARFLTATPTLIPTDTPSPVPTTPPTATPEVTPTIEPTPVADDDASDEVDTSEDAEAVEAETTPTETATPAETATETAIPSPPTAAPTETPTETPAPLSGRIAFPVDDGAGFYDIWILDVVSGEAFQIHQRGRQPSFAGDGRLLINNEGNAQFGEGLAMLGAGYEWLGIVSDNPEDAFPFWHPDNSRYVFSNNNLLIDPSTGGRTPHVFIPCSIRQPATEDEPKCRDIPTFGKVSIGEFPVWTDDDRIAFFDFSGDDGIYVVSSASALWTSGGVGGKALLVGGNGRPNDTAGFQVFFSAGTIDQNWEAYVIDLDGSNLTNLSNSPFSQDGLPTLSPDGNWVAFVSDRDGLWGIWAVPLAGGEPQKIFDISKINTNPSPWGVGERDWTLERMSWAD